MHTFPSVANVARVQLPNMHKHDSGWTSVFGNVFIKRVLTSWEKSSFISTFKVNILFQESNYLQRISVISSAQ